METPEGAGFSQIVLAREFYARHGVQVIAAAYERHEEKDGLSLSLPAPAQKGYVRTPAARGTIAYAAIPRPKRLPDHEPAARR